MKATAGLLLATMVLVWSCGRPVRPPATPAMPQSLHAIVPAPVSVRAVSGDRFAITPATAIGTTDVGDEGSELSVRSQRVMLTVKGSHGFRSTSNRIAELADQWAFTTSMIGVR